MGAGAMQAQTPGSWTPKKQSTGGPIRSGHLLFLGGIGGWYPDKRPKAGDVKQQTGDALTMMKASLEKAGSSLQNVLKSKSPWWTRRRTGMAWTNLQYIFPWGPKPARSYFGATGFRRPGSCCRSTASPTSTKPRISS